MIEADRFWSKVDASGDCWEWTAGASSNGYGLFNRKPYPVAYAHRFAYELLVGPIPEGLQVDHLCRNRRCVNPDHLEAVTHAENVRRGYSPAMRNLRAGRCPNGHQMTPDNTYDSSAAGRGRACRICKLASNKASRERRRLPDLQSSAATTPAGALRRNASGAALVAREDDPAVLPAR